MHVAIDVGVDAALQEEKPDNYGDHLRLGYLGLEYSPTRPGLLGCSPRDSTLGEDDEEDHFSSFALVAPGQRTISSCFD